MHSGSLPGRLSACVPAQVDAERYELVVLAMQEPQYGTPDIRRLLADVAAARIPCLSIMNMPPLPYLARLADIDVSACRTCYTDPHVWNVLDPALVTHCSADPQASRVPDEPENVIRVRLPSNFKAARFECDQHTAMLRAIAADIEAARFPIGTDSIELPVKLRVHESCFVPLAKWPMLIAGNYRCPTPDGSRSIASAVHDDLAQSRSIYEWVLQLCRSLGAQDHHLVTFERYSAAALTLTAPSSVARALLKGVTHVERVDRLVKAISAQRGLRLGALDKIVRLVDLRLAELGRAQRVVARAGDPGNTPAVLSV
jgi:hypothetical protein